MYFIQIHLTLLTCLQQDGQRQQKESEIVVYIGWKYKACEISSFLCELALDFSNVEISSPRSGFTLTVIMNSKSPVGFVLFGMGRIGHTHANSLIREPLAQLKYIVDVEVDKVREFVASNFLDTKIVPPSELETVMADSSVDAAVVCTPTDFHEDLVVRCLKAGKAVFCEKPIAKSLEAIERCYNIALTKNMPLFCGFNRRFDPTISSVAARVKNGDIGRVQIVKTTSRDFPMPPISYLKISGGMFHDCCVHDVDAIC
ncbi:Myo-inositol 2-dehydrogenase, partial [Acropora cervicornis]